MLDLSKEEEQKDRAYGPVPSGSEVFITLEIQEPKGSFAAPEHHMISQARSGLRQIYCKITVERGQYAGAFWYQNITLPMSMQKVSLSGSQEMACKIGGAMLKAILEARKMPMSIKDISAFNGLTFPVQVRINPRPREKDGRVYWSNEIVKVITPKMSDYEKIIRDGEIINPDGAVNNPNWLPESSAGYGASSYGTKDDFNIVLDQPPALDEVPFS